MGAGLDLVLGSGRAMPLNCAGDEPGPADNRIAGDLRRIVALVKAGYGSADGGRIDYAALRDSEDMERIEMCAARLRGLDPRGLLGRDERTAFWINLYNALTVHAIIAFEVEGSVLRKRGFFRRARYEVGEFVLSLDEIEHGILRGNRALPYVPSRTFAPGDARLELTIAEPDPRVHFALNCGSRSCPPIAAHGAEGLDEQLDMAARSFLEGGGMEIDAGSGELRLSRLLKWYGADFAGSGGVVAFLRDYVEPGEAAGLDGLAVVWMDYDWSLNAKN